MSWRRWLAVETERLAETRAVSALTIVAVLLIWLTWILLLWATFPSSALIASIQESSFGLVQPTLIAGALGTAFTLAPMIGLGRLRLHEVGLRGRQMLAGFALVVVMWLVAQGMLVVDTIASGRGLSWSSRLGIDDIGAMIAQLAGNALKEEVVARGFLLVQLALLARRWMSHRAAWLVALLVSQMVFALMHIPHRWVTFDMHGAALIENLAFLLWFGIQLAVIYMRTANLGVCVGLHALSNVHVALVDSPMHVGFAMNILTIAMFVGWPYLARRFPSLAPSRARDVQGAVLG